MAKSIFKTAVSLAKTVNKIERESAKRQRQREMQAQKEIIEQEKFVRKAKVDRGRQAQKEMREQERFARKAKEDRDRQAKLANKLTIAKVKERAKAEITDAEEAYEYRCEKRKFLREQIINEVLR